MKDCLRPLPRPLLAGRGAELLPVGMPHADVLKSIELLGTEVAPRVRAELGK